MHGHALLGDLVVIFAVAVSVVALLRRIGIPSIAGFIVAGILAGPRAFGFVAATENVERLAEIGVVLLLFGIGLELSLERVRRLWRPILVGGTLQMGISVVAIAGVARVAGHGWGAAIVLGFALGVSSTAIVLRGLEARGEVEAPHGRLTLGILIFQDLLVVPIIMLLPVFGAEGSGGLGRLVGPLGAAVAVLAGVMLAARLVVPRLLAFVARTRQRDLFVLSVFLVCIGTAWAVSLAGISLALGAFLAGLVVADSDYKSQALAELIPFREVFTSLFFVSMGMLLDPGVLVRDAWPIFGMLLNLLVGKFVIVFFAAALMRLPLRVCALSATALAQVGEFFFVIMYAAAPYELIDPELRARLPAAVILSMLVTPLLLMLGPHVAAGVGRIRVLDRMLGVRAVDEAENTAIFEDHVIIAGWGIAGQELARALRYCGIPYVIVDLNIENVRAAEDAGEPAYFGDVTNVEVLERLGARHACELVLVINDPSAAARSVEAARRVAPELQIIVRARYVADAPPLLASGANSVVAAELGAAVEIADRVLARHGVEQERLEVLLSRIRAHRGDELGA